MAWKYIMFANKIGDTTFLFPVIFPDKMVHKDVARVLRQCQPGYHAKGGSVVPISAGMIEHVEVTGLGGESETLGLDSNEEDAEVIKRYAYFHGIV